jgi:HK97 family phage major capsid protein/HK97 family phage prohead protease
MEHRAREAVQRAYAILQVKSIDEERREIEGIATTPTPDRMGDVVEPKGAEFKLPIPLLWQHDSRAPIGEVISAKVTPEGITVRARFAKTDEPGKLKERLDEAWQSVKIGLVKGLSIGFKSLEDSDIKDTFGIRFIRWLWLELSAVTIPANGDASITAIKSTDQSLRAAIGAKPAKSVRISNAPVASGSTAAKQQRGNTMKTYKEQISAIEATRAAKAARMDEIQKAASESGRSKDEAQREEFDTLRDEIKSLDEELKDLRDLEKVNAAAAVSVTDGVTDGNKAVSLAVGAGARVTINAKLEPGVKFARMAMCVARAKWLQKEGRFMYPSDIYRAEKRWMDSAPEVSLALKTAVNANDSTTAGAASEWAYAQNIESEFIEFLRPMTLLGRITGWRNVPFNIRVGGMDGGATGYWVGQGIAISNSKPTSTSVSLGITKVAGLTVITKELAMLSSPSAEMMVRNDLARALQQKADTSLIDPNSGGVANVTPASLTYGATARQASGTDYAAFKADWKAIAAPFYAANISLSGAVIIMKEELAEALSLMVTSLGNPQFPGLTPTGGTLMGRPVFTTQVADTSGSPDFDNMLILLQPNEVFLADDGTASVEASDQVSVQMDDATTAHKSTATAAGASLVSMFQTESIAIKAVRHVNWTKARSAACQFIRSAAYV